MSIIGDFSNLVKKHIVMVVWAIIFLVFPVTAAVTDIALNLEDPMSNPIYNTSFYATAVMIFVACPAFFLDRKWSERYSKKYGLSSTTAASPVSSLSRAEQFQKVESMLRVSTRIRQDQMRKVLRMREDEFNDRVFEWAANFGFTIDGDYLVVDQDRIGDFIAQLEQEFASWTDTGKVG